MAEVYQKIGTSPLLTTWCYDAPVGKVVEPSLGLAQVGYNVEEPPTAQEFNFILKSFGEKINHLLQNGIPLWNATTAYTVGNLVNHTNTGWVCVTGNTNSPPTTANGNWKPLAAGKGIKAHARASSLVTTAITTTPTAIPFGVNDVIEGAIAHSVSTDTSRFTATQAGTYEFTVQPQVASLGITADSCTFWLRKNGSTAIVNSGMTQQTTAMNTTAKPCLSVIETLAVNDYIEIMCVATENSRYELSYTVASSPVAGIPACIIAVKGW
jgi:hypothetical protein